MRRWAVGVFVLAIVMGVAALSAPWWLRSAKRQSKWFVVASLGLDAVRRLHLRNTQIGGGTAPHLDASSEVERAQRTFDEYFRYGSVPISAVAGKRVLELGPGATIAVALRFAAAGADHVLALDKFVPMGTSEEHRTVYQTLRARLDERERANFDRTIRLDSGVEPVPERFRYITGTSLEEIAPQMPPQSFDFIVSTAVLEEIYPVDALFAAMDRLLRPGGYLLHRIDLRDYGMFSRYGHHPLEFLTIPEPLYQHMVEASGQPNRRRIDYYRKTVAALGYTGDCVVLRVLGGDALLPAPTLALRPGIDYGEPQLQLVRGIRPRLMPRFAALPDADLIAADIFLAARKQPALTSRYQ